MQKQLLINDINYTLFLTSKNKGTEDYIPDSEYFLGSDICVVYAYLVKKENTPKFIEKINAFLDKVESFNIDNTDLDYLHSINDIAFLHQSIENSEYDFFITDFDMYMCDSESYKHEDEHTEFIQELESLCTFAVYAGSSFNDPSIFDFAQLCLLKKYKEELKKIYTDRGFGFYKDELASFDDFGIVNNTKNKDIYLTFIKLYFPVNSEDKFYRSIEELIQKA
jgi:hypothetical protein